MSALIKVIGLADGTMLDDEEIWLKSYDVEAQPKVKASTVNDDGTLTICGLWGGIITLTHERSDAQVFPDNATAMIAWNSQSTRRPLRNDGRPNKPLTALTVEVQKL